MGYRLMRRNTFCVVVRQNGDRRSNLEDRTHLALENGTPAAREARGDPGGGYKVVSMPRLGGLHHRYNSAA